MREIKSAVSLPLSLARRRRRTDGRFRSEREIEKRSAWDRVLAKELAGDGGRERERKTDREDHACGSFGC